MTKATAIFISVLFFTACSINQPKQKETEIFLKDVNATQFKKLVDAGNGITLDVRAPEEIADGYINNASTVNYYDEDFESKINLIPKDKEIYIYCRSGGRSSEAAEILQRNGFNRIYQLKNGILEWKEMGYPLVKTKFEKDEKIQKVSLSDFEALLKTDKPVLIDFHTVWCAPCSKMAPIIDEIEEEYKDRAIVMRIDVDKSKDVGNAYKIEGVPVFILFKNGIEQWKHNGIVTEDEFKKQIENNL